MARQFLSMGLYYYMCARCCTTSLAAPYQTQVVLSALRPPAFVGSAIAVPVLDRDPGRSASAGVESGLRSASVIASSSAEPLLRCGRRNCTRVDAAADGEGAFWPSETALRRLRTLHERQRCRVPEPSRLTICMPNRDDY